MKSKSSWLSLSLSPPWWSPLVMVMVHYHHQHHDHHHNHHHDHHHHLHLDREGVTEDLLCQHMRQCRQPGPCDCLTIILLFVVFLLLYIIMLLSCCYCVPTHALWLLLLCLLCQMEICRKTNEREGWSIAVSTMTLHEKLSSQLEKGKGQVWYSVFISTFSPHERELVALLSLSFLILLFLRKGKVVSRLKGNVFNGVTPDTALRG